MVPDSRRAALSREAWLRQPLASGDSVNLGYAWCPFWGIAVLVPECDFLRRHDPPVRVSQCNFISYACCIICSAALMVNQCDYWLCRLPFSSSACCSSPWRSGGCFRLRFQSPSGCPLGSFGALDATFIRFCGCFAESLPPSFAVPSVGLPVRFPECAGCGWRWPRKQIRCLLRRSGEQLWLLRA